MKNQSSLSWDLNEIRTSYETIMSTEGCQRLEPEKLKQRFRSGPRREGAGWKIRNNDVGSIIDGSIYLCTGISYMGHIHRLRSPLHLCPDHDQPFTFPFPLPSTSSILQELDTVPIYDSSPFSDLRWSVSVVWKALALAEGDGRAPKRLIINWPTLAGCWGHLTGIPTVCTVVWSLKGVEYHRGCHDWLLGSSVTIPSLY